jgi:hypothetical protein
MSLHVIQFLLHGGETLSDPVDCTNHSRVARIIMPTDWNPAPLSFQLSPDGTAFHDLYHVIPTDLVSFEVAVPNPKAGTAITFPSGMGLDVLWVKIRSGTTAAPVVQQAGRTFQLILESAGTTSGAA